MIVDCKMYPEGRPLGDIAVLSTALGECETEGGFVWLGLHEPTAEEFDGVAEQLGLHPLAVEDAIHAHQRPKVEFYGDSIFVVLKPARYVDQEEIVMLGQFLLFVGEHFVVTVRHGSSDVLGRVRAQLDGDPERLESGPLAVLHAIADCVVDDYSLVLAGIAIDVDQVEHDVFSGPRSTHAERIFRLKREVLEFHWALDPLIEPLESLIDGAPFERDESLRPYFRDVHDHVVRASHRLAVIDGLLDAALSANVAQVGMRQNEDMRKISAWVAVIAFPTLIAGIYGMNFAHMPELDWKAGYPFALAVMAISSFALYRNFKRREWL